MNNSRTKTENDVALMDLVEAANEVKNKKCAKKTRNFVAEMAERAEKVAQEYYSKR